MKKFNFRLQKLLEIRKNDERKSTIQFKSAESEKRSVEEKLGLLSQDYAKYNDVNKGQSTIEKKMLQSYLNALSVNIERTTDLLNQKIKVVEEKRQDLTKKQIDRKIVDTLRNKKFNSYTKEQNLEEQKVNDELALYAYYRSSN